MKRMIDIFSELGERLQHFGDDIASREVIAEAIAQNSWFTERDILRAIDAIRCEMLDRDKLSSWMADYTPTTKPERVAIIMAGNIPLVGFFDLLCVLCSGHKAYIKPSSKDRVLTNYIANRLRDIEPNIEIHPYCSDDSYDRAIATGGEEANAYFRNHFAQTRHLLRGSRHSVAILDGGESSAELEGLWSDITSYSGLGCRSVSMLFIPHDYQLQLPTTEALNPKLRNNVAQRRALYTIQHREYSDYGAFLAIEGSEFSTSLAEVTICRYSDIGAVRQWLTEHNEEIQCVVSHIEIEGCVPFGKAQYPKLTDYADGVDTMQFLA